MVQHPWGSRLIHWLEIIIVKWLWPIAGTDNLAPWTAKPSVFLAFDHYSRSLRLTLLRGSAPWGASRECDRPLISKSLLSDDIVLMWGRSEGWDNWKVLPFFHHCHIHMDICWRHLEWVAQLVVARKECVTSFPDFWHLLICFIGSLPSQVRKLANLASDPLSHLKQTTSWSRLAKAYGNHYFRTFRSKLNFI